VALLLAIIRSHWFARHVRLSDVCCYICVSFFFFSRHLDLRDLLSFPTRRSSDLQAIRAGIDPFHHGRLAGSLSPQAVATAARTRSEEHTSELQSRRDLVCRLLLEKKKKK